MLIVQVAEELPAGTSTELGIEAMAKAPVTTLSVTGISTAAGAFSTTWPVVLSPPTTEDGDVAKVDGTGAVNVTVLAVLYTPSVAVTVVTVLLATELVGCEKLALCVPADTNTGLGLTAGSLLDRLTVSPAEAETPSR